MAEKELKKKKKRWISIIAAKVFENQEIGETLCEEPKEVLGRNIAVNLMALTNDPKTQNISLTFKVKEISNDAARAEPISYKISPSHIKRLLRKNSKKVEDSFSALTKDNVKVQVKPVLFTRFKTNNSVLTALRKKSREFLIESFKNNNFDSMLNNIIHNRVQKELKEVVRKVYPVGICEIRMLEKL